MTSRIDLLSRSMLRAIAPLFAVLALCVHGTAQSRVSFESQIRKAFGAQQGAAVVIEVRSGKVLTSYNTPVLTRRIATPGSAIKPFVLELLLEKHVVRGDETIACRRPLTIAGKRLNCSHPPELSSFDAADALAFSCNSYFVTAAARLRSGELERRLLELGFTRTSGLLDGEGEGRITTSRNTAERQLLAIGAGGIQVTPLELASAYLQLARVNAKETTAAQEVVLTGLRNAVDYGLARNAGVQELSVAGKTGTASDPGNPLTHAWFAGFAPAEKPEVVVVVFVERGRGSLEAAGIAHKIFSAYAEQRR